VKLLFHRVLPPYGPLVALMSAEKGCGEPPRVA
jgi:hypothetical protein